MNTHLEQGEILAPTAPRPVATIPFNQLPFTVQIELKKNARIVPVRAIQLPDAFDARQKWPKAITGPLDQTDCGSCWAFAVATTISDRFRISYPEDAELFTPIASYKPNYPSTAGSYPTMNNISPYQLVKCNICNSVADVDPVAAAYLEGQDKICNFGCEGGIIKYSMDYMSQFGANTLIATNPLPTNPGNPRSFICDFKNTLKVYKTMNTYAITESNDNEAVKIQKIKEEIFIHGPVVVSYMVYPSWQNFFQRNPTGIYMQSNQDRNLDQNPGGHAVVIIGWGKNNGVDYWVVRNSWGIGWGDKGYFKMQANLFNILDDAWGARIK